MNVERIAEICGALGSVVRLQVLFYLYEKASASVSRMEEEFKLKEPNLSYHLKVLRAYRLVRASKRGNVRLYELTPFGKKVVSALERFWYGKGKALRTPA